MKNLRQRQCGGTHLKYASHPVSEVVTTLTGHMGRDDLYSPERAKTLASIRSRFESDTLPQVKGMMRRSGMVKVRLKFKGRAKPRPIENPWTP